MAKKNSLMEYIYVVGMALVVVGFCCPMFSALGVSSNGFKFINFKNSSFVTIGALLIFIGAVAGIGFNFISIKGIDSDTLKFIALIASIVGGVILVIGFTTGGGAYKLLGKGLLKNAAVGFYLVIVGWRVALLGKFISK